MTSLELNTLLEANGWTMECESPLEIRHDESGSFATNLAAKAVLAELLEEAEAQHAAQSHDPSSGLTLAGVGKSEFWDQARSANKALLTVKQTPADFEKVMGNKTVDCNLNSWKQRLYVVNKFDLQFFDHRINPEDVCYVREDVAQAGREQIRQEAVRDVLSLFRVEGSDFYYNQSNDYGVIKLRLHTGAGDPFEQYRGEAVMGMYRDGPRISGDFGLNDAAVTMVLERIKELKEEA